MQGLEQAAALFEELLGSSSARPKRRLRAGTAKESSRQPNALSDAQRMQVDKLLSPICQPHPDPKVSSLLRHGYRVEGRSVVLFESRPAFQKPHEWREHGVHHPDGIELAPRSECLQTLERARYKTASIPLGHAYAPSPL
ncbi:MAG TPA: hypothetical protein VIP09_05785 [Dehalococcoidia bacterium]